MPSAVKASGVSRISVLMQSNLLLNNIRANSVDLLKVQEQMTSGLKISRPSDSPADATTIMSMNSQLERYELFLSNISSATSYLSQADSSLQSMSTLLTTAYSTALEGVGKSKDELSAMANTIDSIISSMLDQANRTDSKSGNYVFGGQNGTTAPFASMYDGILFSGSLARMQTRIGSTNVIEFSMNANEVFGALSSEVVGIADLSPDITSDTLLADLNGVLGEGIRKGAVLIGDGSTSTQVDLSDCVTVGDVVDKLNATGLVTAAIGADGTSLTITTAGSDLTIREVGAGHVARDLGIYDATGGDTIILGQDVDARLTSATPVAALADGAGIDLTSGLIIRNSSVSGGSEVIDLSSAVTMEDVLNAINSSGQCVRAEINSDGTGINVFNTLSGSRMTIGENGGTTATDLGIRSMAGSTKLSDLTGATGIHPTAGAPDLQITDRFGNSCQVDLDSAQTVQDVIDLINAAAAAAGVSVSADLATVGNGIELTMTAAGGMGNLTVTQINGNGYFLAKELGLEQSVASDTLTGEDVNPIEPDGVFSHLIALRDAMLSGEGADVDQAITEIAALIQGDQERIRTALGQVGSQEQAMEAWNTRMEDNILAIKQLRSDIQDIDFTEAITRYQNLYTALQANLMTGSQLTNMSLLDFLG